MMINKKFFLLVSLTIIMQGILLDTLNLINTNFPFLDGIPITSSHALEYRYLLNWYLPIIGMSFYFSGYLSDVTRIHGIAFFVRTYSKSKWIIKQYLRILAHLLLFIALQMFVSVLFDLGQSTFSKPNLIKALSMYLLTLLVLLSIQLLIELYVKESVAHLIINIYIVFSVLITNQLHSFPKLFHYFFLPVYGMGFRNGLSQMPKFKLYTIDYFTGFFILLIIQVALVYFSTIKIKNMDLL
ncbi:DUF2705 family protein [Anoxybacteroides rupiense]|uniref:DUF2705 family protein n=1 Tax=Anoxybacteroides rupiense TaxID=311460 RepID=A0ABD5IZI5_9BACL|nr:DUF2705 family protein [Anoxybacillus rupiensis]MBB3908823.1 hypothetical protein [Anoxybacillus rupiensis]MED5053780.1 DUF2705 family protein [Anoxybacillus rupiensis]